MRNLITILLVSFLNFCFSQEDYIHTQSDYAPKLQDYSPVPTYWQDTTVVHQKLFWSNGKVKVEYIPLHDSIRLRKEYFESGNLKLTAEIYQSFSIDTSYTEDVAKPGTFIIKWSNGYVDMLHGKYCEYWDAIGVAPKTTGSFKYGNQSGEWKVRKTDGSLIVATYNDRGQLDGSYFEYYFSGVNERANLKWKGQFSVVTYSHIQQDERTLTQLGQSTITESPRTGKWEHYNKSGELLETVTYEWLKK